MFLFIYIIIRFIFWPNSKLLLKAITYIKIHSSGWNANTAASEIINPYNGNRKAYTKM
jgi:hypothetical protein